MPKLNDLAKLQACLAQSLHCKLSEHTLDQDTCVEVDLLSNLLVDSHFTSEQLISIYRNNFVMSLKEMLEQIFPVTQALIGDAYFAYVSRQFIHDCPLIEPHLNLYGGAFISFLRGLKALNNMPFVAQMAELEWHLDRIGHIYYVPKFDFHRLSKVDESQVMEIHFSLAATCYLLSSEMNLIDLHKDLSVTKKPTSVDSIDEDSYREQSYILVLQNQQGDSAVMPLNRKHWGWLQGLKNGFSLSQLCECEHTQISPLMAQITDWIALGCIDGFSSKAAKDIPVTTNTV